MRIDKEDLKKKLADKILKQPIGELTPDYLYDTCFELSSEAFYGIAAERQKELYNMHTEEAQIRFNEISLLEQKIDELAVKTEPTKEELRKLIESLPDDV